MKSSFLLGVILSSFISFNASAAVVMLDFEGVADSDQIGDFYNGGAGTNYGISFSQANGRPFSGVIGIIDTDDGGSGNFANEPSGNTVAYLLGTNVLLNYSAGFDTGFSFFHSSFQVATVSVFDGLNGTGNLLGTFNTTAQYNANNCVGDPTGTLCNWTNIGVGFSGTAKSVTIVAASNFNGLVDNVTFGSATAVSASAPVAPVPEPETYAMFLAGLSLLGAVSRRRKQKASD